LPGRGQDHHRAEPVSSRFAARRSRHLRTRRSALSQSHPALPPVRPHRRAGGESDPQKIVAIVQPNAPDETGGFSEIGETTARIGRNVADFLAAELRAA
jgi:acyl-CoA hydrolase